MISDETKYFIDTQYTVFFTLCDKSFKGSPRQEVKYT